MAVTLTDYNEIKANLNRFHNFHDCLVKEFTLSYLENKKRASITFYTRDNLRADQWSIVKFTVHGVTEAACVEKSNETLSVLCHGLHMCKLDNQIALEFGGGLVDPPESIDEVRMSCGYILGDRIEVEVENSTVV